MLDTKTVHLLKTWSFTDLVLLNHALFQLAHKWIYINRHSFCIKYSKNIEILVLNCAYKVDCYNFVQIWLFAHVQIGCDEQLQPSFFLFKNFFFRSSFADASDESAIPVAWLCNWCQLMNVYQEMGYSIPGVVVANSSTPPPPTYNFVHWKYLNLIVIM